MDQRRTCRPGGPAALDRVGDHLLRVDDRARARRGRAGRRSSPRRSTRAWPALVWIASSAPTATLSRCRWVGGVGRRRTAPEPACSAIADTWWATRSCRSPAIRARSASRVACVSAVRRVLGVAGPLLGDGRGLPHAGEVTAERDRCRHRESQRHDAHEPVGAGEQPALVAAHADEHGGVRGRQDAATTDRPCRYATAPSASAAASGATWLPAGSTTSVTTTRTTSAASATSGAWRRNTSATAAASTRTHSSDRPVRSADRARRWPRRPRPRRPRSRRRARPPPATRSPTHHTAAGSRRHPLLPAAPSPPSAGTAAPRTRSTGRPRT